jgi:repressor LexA
MDDTYKKQIRNFYQEHRRLPSYIEIMRLVGFSSRASVWKLITRLVDDGFLFKNRQGKIAPGNIWGELRVLGVVEAGFPSPAEEDHGDMLSLDEYLIPNRDASYMLRVKGDSMQDAGIMEGDMVIVERTHAAKAGNIVVAEVDGAWTMKYLRMKNGRPYLEPANKRYKPIIPKGELNIQAVVRAVVRKY